MVKNMKFKFVKEIEGECSCYGVTGVKTGDEIDLEGRLADKAAKNKDFEASAPKKEGKNKGGKAKGVTNDEPKADS